MSREISVDYEETLLLPPCVEDWVGPNHIARYVRAFVSELDFAAMGFKQHGASTGRRGFSCQLLMSAWLYGHLTRQRSTRALERACSSDMGAIWLTGNKQPDHSTLWSFFNENGARFKKVFKISALVACREGLVDLNFVAIDGTKLRACANNSNAVEQSRLKEALEALDQAIESYMDEVQQSGDQGCDKLPQRLEDTRALRKAISEDLSELENLGVSRISMIDPDSRTMKTVEGQKFAYNAQSAVDESHGIVVGCDVTQDANDSSQLNAMLGQVEETLDASPALTAVDSGYFSTDELVRAKQAGRDLRISMRGRAPKDSQPLHSWMFELDEARNVLVCPIGGQVTFRGRSKTHGGADVVNRYRCADHLECPFAKVCSSDPRGRSVEVADGQQVTLRQWHRQEADPEDKKKGNRRSATVERHFGHVKRNRAFRQLEHRGLDNAKSVWCLWMCCTNLLTLAKKAGYVL